MCHELLKFVRTTGQPYDKTLSKDSRGEPAGGRSQQDGGILREEDGGPGAGGSVREGPLA